MRPETLYGNRFEGYLQQSLLPDNTNSAEASIKRAVANFFKIGNTRDEIISMGYDQKLVDAINLTTKPQVQQ